MTFSGGFGKAFRPVFDPGLTARNGLLNSLIAYWPLNEAAGANNALDLHSNALTMTQVSSPGADIGIVYSTARTFDGSADYFTRNSGALLQVGDVEMTVAVWCYITNKSKVRVVCGKRNAAVQYEWQLSYNNTSDAFVLGVSSDGGTGAGLTGVTATTFGSPALNTWHLVIIRHDPTANQIAISVNGGAEDTASHASGIYAGPGPFRLANNGYDTANSWQGHIGPVAFWKSAAGGGGVLTAAQRTALYNGGAGLAYANFTT